jgi:hypothetical protein
MASARAYPCSDVGIRFTMAVEAYDLEWTFGP